MSKFNIYEGGDCTKAQRLVDKDGFAFPAPGGLHKDVFPDKLNLTTFKADDTDQEEQNELRENDDFLGLNNKSNLEESGSDSIVNPLDKPSHKGAAFQHGNSRGTMMELMSNFIQETNNLQSEWSKIFSQSEDFEFNCLQKLDAFTEKAKKLDKDLERQKNALCHRIRGIGGILHSFD